MSGKTAKRMGIEILILFAFVGLCGSVFSLESKEIFVLGFVGLFLLPLADRYMVRAAKNEEKYRESVSYMEQFLCSYKRTSVVGTSLEDCRSLFESSSDMNTVLQSALHILKTGEEAGENILRAAFGVIGENYPSRRMKLMHEYVIKVEQMGGRIESWMDLLLREIQLWKERTLLYQKKKSMLRRESFLSILMSMGLCWLSNLLIPSMFRKQLVASAIYQISTMVTLILFMILAVLILANLTRTWLDCKREPKHFGEGKIESQYERIKKNKHSIGGYFAKKSIIPYIREEFPYWLLTVILFLQQDSLYQAVSQSSDHVHGFFKKEVQYFLEQLYEDPVSLHPYQEFFSEFFLPEIQTGMKMLYAFRQNGYEDTSRQIYFLIEQNNLIMDQVERQRLEDQLGVMGILRQIPMGIATAKVILDVVFIFILSFGRYFVV